MKIYIDGTEIEVQGGETVLEACRRMGTHIPSMCFAPGKEHKPSCMVCMVKNEASGQMMSSCSTYPTEGMRIDTRSEEVQQTRRLAVKLLLSDHRADCEAPCTIACPKKLDIAEMLYHYDEGNYPKAKATVASAFALPQIGCDECKAPCEKVCRRGTVDAHVPIREIVKKLANMEDIPVKGDPSLLSHIDRTRFSSRLGAFTPQEKIRLKETVTTPSTCLHCACLSKEECTLRDVAISLSIKSPRFGVNSLQPFKAEKKITGRLVFEPSKCIRCGLCVYNTEDGFTFRGRGFGMQVILPEESYSHVSEDISSLCPTGALSLLH